MSRLEDDRNTLDSVVAENSAHVDHRSQFVSHIKPFPDRLHVVAVVFNPIRWASRYKHWAAFERMVHDQGGVLYVVELALGDRPFEVVKSTNPRHLGLRTLDELWHKERMIRMAIQHLLPAEARYIAWWDADIAFSKPNICQETLQALQHHYIVQCYSHAIDLGPNDEPLWTTPGFMFEWVNHGALQGIRGAGKNPWNPASCYEHAPHPELGWSPISAQFGKDWKICHPGLAWAADREALDRIDGGIFDESIYGSGDWIMALSWVGLAKLALMSQDWKTNEFSRRVMAYQDLCENEIHRDVGYVPGTVYHYFHGRKSDRRYSIRPNSFLVELGFDPRTDIKRDTQGLYKLATSRNPRSQRLRDALRYFARIRNEDGNEV